MTIAFKIRAFSIILFIVTTAFGYSFWQTSNNLKNQSTVNEIVQDIIKATFEFNIITNEYINSKNIRVKSQWNNSHASLEVLFFNANKFLFHNDDKYSLKIIMANETQGEDLIFKLLKMSNVRKNILTKYESRKITQIRSQIQVRIQGMLSEASKMSRRSHKRLRAAENQLEFISASLIFIFLPLFIASFIFIDRKVIKPIVDLQKSAKQLSSGDYDTRIVVKGKDEVSALANSYNVLASEIQKKITDLTDKSHRLTESQKELLTLNNNLQNMVDEQTSDLRNSENKQRAILESMDDGVITLNKDFIIKNINPAVTTIFGYSADDIINKNINIIIAELKNIEEQTEILHETEAHHKNGQAFPVEITLHKMIIDNTIMFTCIVRDITERKRIEKMKDEFVSTVSHELRTPLTSIRGALGLVTSGALDDLPEKAHELLVTANRNAERLMHLINDILDMQKIEAGKLEFSISKVNLMDAVEKSITDNYSYAKQHHVHVEVDDVVDNIFVDIDPLRLAQIMSNLLSNAAKFSKKESTVYIHTSIQDKFAKVSVVDSGVGIPEEYFDKIFNKFSQSDSSATRQKGGTGLGLAITKQMIESMDGSIDFTSTVGKGTTFSIYIPINQDSLV